MPDNKLYEKQLSASYWFVTHKLLLKNIFLTILIVFIIFLVAMDLYLLVFNFGIYGKSYEAMLDSLVKTPNDYVAMRQALLPRAILINNIKTFQNARGYDIVADITNPNQYWYGVFNYQFQVGNNLSSKRTNFILPGESKVLMDLAVENGNLASSVVISNIAWAKEINYPALFEEKYKFEFKNIEYIPAQQLGVTDKVQVSRVKFEGTNKSAYNYKNIIFQIFLKSGENIVGVNQLASGQLMSGETKTFEINFFQSLPRITGVNIAAEVNILDEKSFINF